MELKEENEQTNDLDVFVDVIHAGTLFNKSCTVTYVFTCYKLFERNVVSKPDFQRRQIIGEVRSC